MNIRILVLILSIVTTGLLPAELQAQEEPTAVAEATETTTEDPTTTSLRQLERQLEQHQQELARIEDRTRQQEETAQALRDGLNILREDQSQLEMTFAEQATQTSLQRFRIFGFMDTSFTMVFPENYTDKPDWGNVAFMRSPRKSTFYMNNINLYFKSEMTDTLEALVETRFTFQPNGAIVSFPIETRLLDEQGNTIARIDGDTEWNRTNTTTRETYDGSFRLGGVAIERAHLDWKPSDRFNFRAGRYLTPYGIWNEDHGATVLLTTAVPLLVRHQYVPAAQTGLMVFGRGFPTPKLDLEYALTVSNGRGPTTEVYDLDSNKALGLRGRANLRIGEFTGSLGAYGYHGKYTDTRDRMQVHLNETGTGFADMKNPIRYVETVTEQYKETVLALDLRISFRRLEFFGEWVRGKIEYTQQKESDPLINLLENQPQPERPAISPHYIKQAVYLLASWELPLHNRLKQVRVKPYMGVDIMDPHDVYDFEHLLMAQFGINIKPSPFVTLKSGANYVRPLSDTPIWGTLWYWTQQLAVSF